MIISERLTLTCAEMNDMRLVYDMANEDQEIHDMMFCNSNEEMTWEEYSESESLYYSGIPCRHNYWMIRYNGAVIGAISHSYNDAAIENMEIDIWLRSAMYLGRGFGTEAVTMLIEYLHKKYDVRTFIMRPGKHNLRAIRCYEKCGFVITADWNASDYYGENAGDWGDGDYGVDGTVNMVKRFDRELPTHIVATGGYIRNGDGKVLLVKHPRRGWEFPGGQVEVGETIPQALKREVYEEARVEIEINRLVTIGSNISVREGYNGVDKIPTIVSMYFTCTYISGEPRISEEHLDIGWFSEDEMFSIITRPGLLNLAKDMINFNGQIHYYAYNVTGDFFDEMMI